jgi:hypothetical protein
MKKLLFRKKSKEKLKNNHGRGLPSVSKEMKDTFHIGEA